MIDDAFQKAAASKSLELNGILDKLRLGVHQTPVRLPYQQVCDALHRSWVGFEAEALPEWTMGYCDFRGTTRYGGDKL